MHAILREISRFARDKSGNLVVIFAFACVPLISAVGCAIDYSVATRMKAKMQSAADSASVAAISQRSPGYVAAAAMSTSGPVPAAVTDANAVFDSNISATTGYANLNRTSTVTKTGIILNSSVVFSADVPVTFMKVLGYQKLTVTGVSSASASLPPYLDFYLMLDVSGSMGLPSTDAEQTRLSNVNPDNFSQYPGGCTLACHFTVANSCGNGNQKYPTGNACLGYWISRTSPTAYANLIAAANSGSLPKATPPSLPTAMITSGLPDSLLAGNARSVSSSLAKADSCPDPGRSDCIQLRADAVGEAVKELFSKAQTSKKVDDQFRIGLYPFVQNLYAYFALTKDINGLDTNTSTINYAAKNLASQLDTNANSGLGSGGTHFENAFSQMKTIVTGIGIGDGSSPSNTQPFVFLVTDGAQNFQIKALNGGSWSNSNAATTIPLGTSSYCKPLRDVGITVAVLYIPYQPIQNPNHSFAGDEDGAANTNIPFIEPSLRDCASPGFYYSASTPQGIKDALKAMFDHALVTAHITN